MGQAGVLIGLSTVFLAGLALEALGRRIQIPRVTLLILLGTVLGPPGLDLLPAMLSDGDTMLAPVALTMVAFLLGSSLHRDTLRAQGRAILTISISVAAVSVLLVTGGLVLAGVPLATALLLGGISAATDPAATLDVIRESGREGRFTNSLQGIVAVDDAWGLLAFSGTLMVAGLVLGTGENNALQHGLTELGGSLALGLAIGLPAAALTGRVKPGEPTLVEALGIVFLCAGLAMWLELSLLLVGMVAGATVANLARHHERPFHEIERIEWPFLLLFFVMAGATLNLEGLAAVGAVGLGYAALRALGRVLGAWGGARLAGLSGREGRLTGLSLMPQAGVAIGMALVVSERFPQLGETILTIAIASTVLFEIVGPLMTLLAIRAATRDGTV